MSGPKDHNLAEFYRLLHSRAITTGDLAAQIGCSRAHLTRVLNGTRAGHFTWRKILPLLTEKEKQKLLAFCSMKDNGPRGLPVAAYLAGLVADSMFGYSCKLKAKFK